jgi:hypothetical protein
MASAAARSHMPNRGRCACGCLCGDQHVHSSSVGSAGGMRSSPDSLPGQPDRRFCADSEPVDRGYQRAQIILFWASGPRHDRLIRQPCCPLYLLAVEREAMVVGNDITPLCLVHLGVLASPGADFAAEEAVIVFGAYRPTVLAQSAECPASCRAPRSISRPRRVVRVPPEMAVLTCFPATGRCRDNGLQDVGRRQGM